ncbi:MAG TPA: hypothetical protein VK157_15155 [Phycisphaerales bacterium]|nr:hypothetical protein [Phycisphaerales bacterium]
MRPRRPTSFAIRLAKLAAFALLLGIFTTVVVATVLANARAWREAAETRVYANWDADGVVCNLADGTNYFNLREATQPGFKLSIVNHLDSTATLSGDGKSLTFIGQDRDYTLPISHTPLPARLDPRNASNANCLVMRTCGWPSAALGYREYSSHLGCSFTDLGVTHWLAVTPRAVVGRAAWQPIDPAHPSPDHSWGIPTSIDPRGFAIDTAAFGSTFFASFLLIAFIRDRRAQRHNICPHCSYNRDGIDAAAICPECGKPA